MVKSLEKNNKTVFIFFYNVLKRVPPQGLENSEMCAPWSNFKFLEVKMAYFRNSLPF